MFKKKNENGDISSNEHNQIASNTTVKGEINAEGNFRIDGTIYGSIFTNGKIIIGPSGKVEGEMQCADADVSGIFIGKAKLSKLLSLRSSANFSGEVTTSEMLTEPGAIFNATCVMTEQAKLISEDTAEAKMIIE